MRWLTSLAVVCLFLCGASFAQESDKEFLKAIERNEIAKVQQFILAGADVNKRELDIFGNPSWTPLESAAADASPEMIDLLIRSGAKLHSGLLKTAAIYGKPEVVKMLVKYEPTEVDSVLTEVVKGSYKKKTIKTLVEAGAKPQIALNAAILEQDEPFALDLINRGADVLKVENIPTFMMSYKSDPLHSAAYYGLSKVVDQALRRGVSPDLRDGRDWTLLFAGSEGGSVEVAKALLEAGANVNSLNGGTRETPLFMAAKKGRVDLVKFLLDKGADPTIRSFDGTGRSALEATQRRLDLIVRNLQENHSPLIWNRQEKEKKDLEEVIRILKNPKKLTLNSACLPVNTPIPS